MSFVVTHSFVRLMKAQLYLRIQTSTGDFCACLIFLHIPSGCTNLISFQLNVKLNQVKLNLNTEFMLLLSKDIIQFENLILFNFLKVRLCEVTKVVCDSQQIRVITLTVLKSRRERWHRSEVMEYSCAATKWRADPCSVQFWDTC